MKEKIVGLVRGRHAMPVDEYIFDGVEDPMDFDGIYRQVDAWVSDHMCVGIKSGVPINAAGYTDVDLYKADSKLVVYVTGLSSALAAVISACAYNGVQLELMHYDTSSGEYRRQCVLA